jgi:hypothetical protein
MNTTYAAFDETAIWGTGATPEAAIADAVQWVNAEDAAALRASCSTAIMTPELAAIVATTGGNTAASVLADGRLGTDEQHYAQA